jgi:hypothetical protein
MVPSFVITITIDSEHLMCGGFSLGETVHLGSFEFIADYFSSLSFSPWRGNSGATFMGSTRSGIPSPQRAMIEDSVEQFLMVSSGEGGFSLPSPVTTTPWMENALADQAMMTVPPRMTAPWPDTDLPFKQHCAHQGRQQAQTRAPQPTAEPETAPW